MSAAQLNPPDGMPLRDRIIGLLGAARMTLDYESLYAQSGFTGPRHAFDLVIGRLVHERVILRMPSELSPGFVLSKDAARQLEKKMKEEAKAEAAPEISKPSNNKEADVLMQRAENCLLSHYKFEKNILCDALRDIRRETENPTIHNIVDITLELVGQ